LQNINNVINTQINAFANVILIIIISSLSCFDVYICEFVYKNSMYQDGYYNQNTIDKSNIFETTVKLSALLQKLLIIIEYFLCIRKREQILFSFFFNLFNCN